MKRSWRFIPAAVTAAVGLAPLPALSGALRPFGPPPGEPAAAANVAPVPATLNPGANAVVEMHSARRSGVVSIWLRNGVLVHHRAMVQPKGLVVVTLSLAGAEVLESADNRGISLAAAAAIDRLWACDLDGQSVAKELEGLDVHVEAGAAPDALVLRVWGPTAAIETGFRAIRQVLSCPRVLPEAFPDLRARIGKMTHEWSESERGVIWEAVVDSMFPPHEPRVRGITPQQLDRLTPEDVQVWLERHAAHAPIEASIVGDIPLERALRLSAENFAPLPERERITPRTYAELRVIPEVHVGECVGGAAGGREFTHATPDSKTFVVCGFFGRGVTDVREHRVMRVIASILDGRMTARLAEENLLPADGVNVSWVQSSVYPGFGRVVASVTVEPDRAPRVRELLGQVLAESSHHPVTTGEVADSAERLAQTVDTLEKDPTYWARLLARSRAWALDPELMIDGALFYRGLRPADVEGVFARHCTDANRIEIIIRPEAPAPAEADNAARKE